MMLVCAMTMLRLPKGRHSRDNRASSRTAISIWCQQVSWSGLRRWAASFTIFASSAMRAQPCLVAASTGLWK